MTERGDQGIGELISEGWRILQEVVETGVLTLKSGEQRIVTTKEVLAAARYAASLKPPREKRMPLPEDWTPARTR